MPDEVKHLMTRSIRATVRVPAAPRRYRRSSWRSGSAKWVGNGPVLEEDIAQANVGLDLLGQARLWLGYAGDVEARCADEGATEDELAFLRDGGEFRNLLLVEQPNGSFADTMARQFYFDQWHLLLLARARSVGRRTHRGIAAKARKEVAYHAERSTDWVMRLGDGTAESHAKMQSALGDALDVHRRNVRARRARFGVDRGWHRRRRSLRCAGRGWRRVRGCVQRSDARGPRRRLDAGRERPRRQAGRPHRALRASARRDCNFCSARIRVRNGDACDACTSPVPTRAVERHGEPRRHRWPPAPGMRSLRLSDPEIPIVSIVELGIVRGVRLRRRDSWSSIRDADVLGLSGDRRHRRRHRRAHCGGRRTFGSSDRDTLCAAVDHRLDRTGSASASSAASALRRRTRPASDDRRRGHQPVASTRGDDSVPALRVGAHAPRSRSSARPRARRSIAVTICARAVRLLQAALKASARSIGRLKNSPFR